MSWSSTQCGEDLRDGFRFNMVYAIHRVACPRLLEIPYTMRRFCASSTPITIRRSAFAHLSGLRGSPDFASTAVCLVTGECVLCSWRP